MTRKKSPTQWETGWKMDYDLEWDVLRKVTLRNEWGSVRDGDALRRARIKSELLFECVSRRFGVAGN
jgi:hypothetical protein